MITNDLIKLQNRMKAEIFVKKNENAQMMIRKNLMISNYIN